MDKRQANITPVPFRSRRERGRHGRRSGLDAFHGFLEWLRGRSQENAESAVTPFGSLESDLPRPGYGEEVPIPGLPDTIKGIDTTDRGAGVANYEVDLSQSEFESALSKLGWTKEPSKDGKVMNYAKDGARYSVREFSGSTEGPTAEFFHPFSSRSDADMKLRLRKD